MLDYIFGKFSVKMMVSSHLGVYCFLLIAPNDALSQILNSNLRVDYKAIFMNARDKFCTLFKVFNALHLQFVLKAKLPLLTDKSYHEIREIQPCLQF